MSASRSVKLKSALRALLVLSLVVGGCDGGSVPTSVEGPRFDAHDGNGRQGPDVPRLWLGRFDRDIDTLDQVLIGAVSNANGRVVIGFKPPRGSRSARAGFRDGMSRASIEWSRRRLRALGVAIEHEFSWGGVVATIDPEAAAQIRRQVFVDFVEPETVVTIPISGSPPATTDAIPDTRFADGLVAPIGGPSRIRSGDPDDPWGLVPIQFKQHFLIAGIGKLRASGLLQQWGREPMAWVGTGTYWFHENMPVGIRSYPQNCGSGQPYDACDTDWGPNYYPGTHAFSLIASRLLPAGTALGAADARHFKWCWQNGNGFSCNLSLLAAAIDDAVAAGVRVIGVSASFTLLGGNQAVQTSIAAAWAAGAVVFVAAPDHNQEPLPGRYWITGADAFPLNIPSVVGVASVKLDSTFASHDLEGALGNACVSVESVAGGPYTDIVAPVTAWSSWGPPTNNYALWCSSSVSTALVMSSAMLVWADHPEWTNTQIVEALTETAHDLGPTGWDDRFGHGLVDAYSAYNHIPYEPPVLNVNFSGPTWIYQKGVHQWVGSAIPEDPNADYSWRVSYDGGSWIPLGNQPTLNMMVYLTDSDFELEYTVHSPLLGQTGWKVEFVTVCTPGECEIEQ